MLLNNYIIKTKSNDQGTQTKIVLNSKIQEFYHVSQALRQQCKTLVSKLSQQLSQLNLQKQYLNCFKQHLKQCQTSDIKEAIEQQLMCLSQKNSIFNQIRQKKYKRKNILFKIKEFMEINKQIQVVNNVVLSQFLEGISKLRKYSLSYIQQILKMCCLYSQQNCDNKQSLLKLLKNIFKKIDEQHTSIKKSYMGKFLPLGDGFDPLFLNYLSSKQKTATDMLGISKVFSFDIALSSRLIHAHNQMLICFISKKDACCKFDINSATQQQQNKDGSFKKLLINSPQNQKKKNTIKFNNYRKRIGNSLEKEQFMTNRYSLSPNQPLTLTSTYIRSKSTDLKTSGDLKSQKFLSQVEVKNRGKKLNFKTVLLDPLQAVSDSSDNNTLGNKSFRSRTNMNKIDQKNIHSLKSQKIQSPKSEIKKKYIRYNNFEQDNDEGRTKSIKIRKLQDLIKCNKSQKFQTQQENSPRNSVQLNNKKQIVRCNENNQQSNKIKNRARRITQVQGQYEDSPKRGNTPQGQQLKKQIQHTLINLKQVQNRLKAFENINLQVQNNSQQQGIINQQQPQFRNRKIIQGQQTPLLQRFPEPSSNQNLEQEDILHNQEQNKDKTINLQQNVNKKLLQKAIAQTGNTIQQQKKQTNTVDKTNKAKSVSKPVKKVQIKPTQLNVQNLQKYFQMHKIDHEFDYLLEQAKHNHFYVSQFYLGEELAIIVIVSYLSDRNAYNIRLWHVVSQFLASDKSRQRFISLAFKKYLQYLQSHTSCDQILFQGHLDQNLQSNKFELLLQNLYSKKRTTQKTDNCNQFLSIFASMINFKQKTKQSILYSDQIQEFKDGKYFCNPKLFQFKKQSDKNMINDCQLCFTQLSSLKFDKVNEQLQKQNYDTYSFGDQFLKLSQQGFSSSNQGTVVNVNLLKMCERLKTQFFVAKGHIRMSGALVFYNNNQIICSVNLTQRHKIYFGKGFQHIINMTNKIVHYKSMKTNQKQIQFWAKMFTKQLYGEIKYAQEEAVYGNWEINFAWKQQIQGKVNHSLNNDIIYGQSQFFICVQCGDQIILGAQIGQNDFLF